MEIITTSGVEEERKRAIQRIYEYQADWNYFAKDILQANLDREQRKILETIQHQKLISVVSGTARGKDYVAGVAATCFLYLTPYWDKAGKLVGNTKVALTAPTGRQINIIMMPEIKRLHQNARCVLPGRLQSNGVRTDYDEWFLTAFKADESNYEAWTGFHAVNTMFVVTEATGIVDTIYEAIEGNLQGNSKLLLVFNYNVTTGYAAQSQRSKYWARIRLDSLTAPNVIEKRTIIPGQVDYIWIKERVERWCTPIRQDEFKETEGDFTFEGQLYRPNDLFRVKVRGLPPKVSGDTLVPYEWVEQAVERWKKNRERHQLDKYPLRLGVDIAGMGRDSSSFCHRHGNRVDKFFQYHSGGQPEHMKVNGMLVQILKSPQYYNASKGLVPQAFIDTIGEGAQTISRIDELKEDDRILKQIPTHSVKFSESAKNAKGTPYTDISGEYEFALMRDYCYWCVRDWLNPDNGQLAELPDGYDYNGLINLKWTFRSDGKIKMQKKEDLIEAIGHSPDIEDSLAVTFYPRQDINPITRKSGEHNNTFKGFA